MNTEVRTRKPMKMRVKLFINLVVYVLVALFLLWSLQIFLLDNFYFQLTKSRMTAAATQITQFERFGTSDFSQKIYSLAVDNEFCISVFGGDGRLLTAADVGGGCMIHNVNDKSLNELYRQALENGGEYFHHVDLKDFQNNIKSNMRVRYAIRDRLIFVSIAETAHGPLIMIFDAATSPIGIVKAVLAVQLLFTTLVLAALSAFLANLLAKNLSRPIADVNRAAKKLTHGEYDVKFTGESYREIYELSETLNRTATDLQRTEQLKKDLIANISHDLRTPLTLITGYCEMMRDIEGENTPENIQTVIDEATRMSSLVRDLIDLSQYESGAVKLEKTSLDLDYLVLQTVERYTRLMADEGYTFEYKSVGPTFVSCDRKRIEQVLYNLINNAVNYGGEDKKVVIRLCDGENGRKRVEVIDNGIGIAKEDLPYIFDRYYKVDKEHKREASGTGIGLSIVKNILENHGALYGVQSEPGKGSIFYFEL